MELKSDYQTIFIGNELKNHYEELKKINFNIRYFEKVEDFINHIREKYVCLEEIVLFTYSKNNKSCVEIVQKLNEFFEYFFTVVATVCVINKIEDINNYLPVIKNFDYVIDLRIRDKEVKTISSYVYSKKREELERKKYELINQAVVLDMYNEFVKKGEKNIPAFYYGVDHDGILRTIDDKILKILGFSRDEIIGRRFSELIVNEELEKVAKAFKERRTGERGSKALILKLKRKDGGFSEFLVDSQGVHIPTVWEKPQKEPGRLYVGTFGRIKKVDDKKASSEIDIDFFNVTNEPVFIYIVEDHKLLLNRGSEKFLGYSKDEVIDKDPSFFEKDEYSYFLKAMEDLRTKNHIDYATVIVKKSGELINCDVSIDRVKFNDKHYVIGIYRDISDFINFINKADSLIQLTSLMVSSKSKEELIKMATGEIVNILDVLYLGVALWDDNRKDFDSVYLNNRVRGEFIENYSQKSAKKYFEIMKKSISEDIVKYYELNRTLKNPFREDEEEIKAGEFISVPLSVNGTILGCMFVITDYFHAYTLKDIRMMEHSGHVISSGLYRYQLESELKKNLDTLEKKVKERTKELEEFVYTVSHDLKSPLYAARSFAEIIDEELTGKFKSKEDSYILRRIGENIETAIKMIDDLLSLSRVGTAEMKVEKINLRKIIDEYILLFKVMDKSDIKLNIKLAKSSVPIYGDRGRIKQLFTNLFDNSIKYRKDDNVIIKVSSNNLNGKVRIVVEDNGIGINKDEIGSIFNVFYRGQRAIDRKVEGSGCGLSIVKKIVDIHNGTISVESNPGEGTKFIIYLPKSGV